MSDTEHSVRWTFLRLDAKCIRTRWDMGVDILRFVKGRVFDNEVTRVMGDGFDTARRMLHDKGQPAVVQELIAQQIIALAVKGERNAEELAQGGPAHLPGGVRSQSGSGGEQRLGEQPPSAF